MKNSQPNILNLVRALREKGPVILLESQMEEHPESTKSYLAGMPTSWIKAKGSDIEIIENGELSKSKQNPWKAIQSFKRNHDWLFGYFGYDLKNSVEELSSVNKVLIDAPDLFFFCPDVLLEINNDGRIQIIKGEVPDIEKNSIAEADILVQPEKSITTQNYIQKIEQVQRDIYEGNYYELNLSHALEFYFEGDSLDLYEKMKKLGPVPFAAYMDFDGISICSSSPERFLAKRGHKVWSQPIKGTAKRDNDGDVKKEISELQHSEKERAENLMIVDLVRNDLNRIARKNSVQVRDLFQIQSFETVHQMVSTVECEVNEGTDLIDIIKTCFPMGSMTGAPKIAAMKAIEDYESYKRGIYSGAMGYLSPTDDFDFNVLIRTAIIEGNNLIYPVGGAITGDSNPQAEWEETITKAKAITEVESKNIQHTATE